jgi:hypothetical protein
MTVLVGWVEQSETQRSLCSCKVLRLRSIEELEA